MYELVQGKDLRHKFLMAQESDVVDFSDESFPKEIEVIPLPGHFFDMVGGRMPDNVVFLADCISSRETLCGHFFCFCRQAFPKKHGLAVGKPKQVGDHSKPGAERVLLADVPVNQQPDFF